MSENGKTLTYLGAAIVIVGLAYWTNRPPSTANGPLDETGEAMFRLFTDPLAVKSLDILEYDEETATLSPFQVIEVDGVWSIPTHENYPADAQEHLAKAATSLIGLKRDIVVSESRGSHALYGVVEPDPDKLEGNETGVGKRVTLSDNDGKQLACLIIGKQDEDQTDLYFVRLPERDRVYRVKIDPSELSTKFEDWIEKDLLKLNSFDVKQIVVGDYSIENIGGRLVPRQRGSFVIDYDNAESKWLLSSMKVVEGTDVVDRTLADDEELDAQILNDLKLALDDLKIVDVARKPEGLSADLSATGDVVLDNESALSLQNRGFYLAQVSEGQTEIFSEEGDVRCGMNDGVEYELRFGSIAGQSSKSSSDEAKGEGEDPDATESEEGGAHRYLFVKARFNPALIPPPELEPLPEAPAGAPAPETKPTDGEAAEGDSVDGDATEGDEAAYEPVDEAAAELERIKTENQRKQDEYDDKITMGKEHVQELNERFADWYYVIDNETYKKIHLSHDQIIKKKEGAEGESSPDAGLGIPMPDPNQNPIEALEAIRNEGLPSTDD